MLVRCNGCLCPGLPRLHVGIAPAVFPSLLYCQNRSRAPDAMSSAGFRAAAISAPSTSQMLSFNGSERSTETRFCRIATIMALRKSRMALSHRFLSTIGSTALGGRRCFLVLPSIPRCYATTLYSLRVRVSVRQSKLSSRICRTNLSASSAEFARTDVTPS